MPDATATPEVIFELIAVGREVLDGRVLDTNSVQIAEALRPLGHTPRFAQRVDDVMERVIDAFTVASRRSRVVLVTGGLGPTSDDLTAEAFARFAGAKLVLNPEALAQVRAVFEHIKATMTKVQEKQAWLPPAATILTNREGTAPGFTVEHAGVSWYFMPGVPREMSRMLRDEVLPRLPRTGAHRSMTWATQFTSEGRLQESLTPIEKRLPPGFELTYRTRYPENLIALYADCAAAGTLVAFESLCAEIGQALGPTVFTTARDDEKLKSLEEVVVDRLKATSGALVTVESCTGGQLASRLTDVPGVSEVYWGTIVSYDNTAKTNLANVPEKILRDHGAVSPETAAALAAGGLERLRQSLASQSLPANPGATALRARRRLHGVATTGIAGPGGGTAEKPVGLCFIAIASCDPDGGHAASRVEEIRARPGLDRARVRAFFSQKALETLRVIISTTEVKS